MQLTPLLTAILITNDYSYLLAIGSSVQPAASFEQSRKEAAGSRFTQSRSECRGTANCHKVTKAQRSSQQPFSTKTRMAQKISRCTQSSILNLQSSIINGSPSSYILPQASSGCHPEQVHTRQTCPCSFHGLV